MMITIWIFVFHHENFDLEFDANNVFFSRWCKACESMVNDEDDESVWTFSFLGAVV